MTHKIWKTSSGGDTRDSHKLANNQRVPIRGLFRIGGELLRLPSDPEVSFKETANCRCGVTYSKVNDNTIDCNTELRIWFRTTKNINDTTDKLMNVGYKIQAVARKVADETDMKALRAFFEFGVDMFEISFTGGIQKFILRRLNAIGTFIEISGAVGEFIDKLLSSQSDALTEVEDELFALKLEKDRLDQELIRLDKLLTSTGEKLAEGNCLLPAEGMQDLL